MYTYVYSHIHNMYVYTYIHNLRIHVYIDAGFYFFKDTPRSSQGGTLGASTGIQRYKSSVI
jgi:hypothetical protein